MGLRKNVGNPLLMFQKNGNEPSYSGNLSDITRLVEGIFREYAFIER